MTSERWETRAVSPEPGESSQAVAQGEGPGRGHGSQNGGHGAAWKTKAARVCRPGLGPRAPTRPTRRERPSRGFRCVQICTRVRGNQPQAGGLRPRARAGTVPGITWCDGPRDPSFVGHWVKYSERFCPVVE